MIDRLWWRYTHRGVRNARFRRWLQQVLPARPQARRNTSGASRWRTTAWTFAAFGVLLGMVLGVILAVPLSPGAQIVRGAPSPVDLRAPRDQQFESEVATRREQERAASSADNIVTRLDRTLPDQQRDALAGAINQISTIRSDAALSTAAQTEAISQLATTPVSPAIAQQIVQLDPNRWQVVADESRRLYDEVWQNNPAGLSTADVARIKERDLPYRQLAPTLDDNERRVVIYLVDQFLKPNLTIDEDATALNREADRRAVKPVVVNVVKGQNIVRRGDIVNEEVYEKLVKLNLVFGAGGRTAQAQQFLLGLLVAALLATYLFRYQTSLGANQRALAVLGGLLAVVVLAARLLVPSWQDAPYAFPLAALAVLLTVLFDGRIGLMSALVVAPLIGLQADQSVGLSITLVLGSAAGVFVAQRAARSISFVWVGLAVAVFTMLGALVFWMDQSSTMALVNIPLTGMANGVASSILALGTYHVLGRLANVVTPFQLMELAHPNNPLLHRLMREAPGTYHHSMVVSNLAEVAAENIGADPLLTRVGAYYHDVGKILRPYFFTDNQAERSNVHDNLDPKTSASIIIDHVREGIKLAQEAHLPQPVIDFIAQHHGTNLVSFFWQRALQEDSEANIEDFRYPGPKPQTREAGIMMLADGVEATVRAKSQSGKLRPMRPDENGAIVERGTQSIRDIVDQIVTERVRSEQLDECPLTLRDIAVIKESFISTLQGIYHPRVEYPQV